MPEDKKYKYILVVVDLYDGRIDCEPLKTKSNKVVIDAFTKIYSRKYLKFPVVITLDQGCEFKGKTQKFFNDYNTNVKYALTARHRQLASVERANQKIQTILFKRMANQELITGEVDKQWVKDLKPLVNLTSNNDMVARTKNQLQVVSDKEKEPDVRFLLGNPEFFIIKEILDKRIRNRKTEYKVRWKGFPLEESSWILGSEFNRTKELKALMNKFNEHFK